MEYANASFGLISSIRFKSKNFDIGTGISAVELGIIKNCETSLMAIHANRNYCKVECQDPYKKLQIHMALKKVTGFGTSYFYTLLESIGYCVFTTGTVATRAAVVSYSDVRVALSIHLSISQTHT